MRSINIITFSFSIIAILFAIKVSNFFLPDRYYFSFSSFLYGSSEVVKIFPLIIKLIVPFSCAFAICLSIRFYHKKLSLLGRSKSISLDIENQLEISVSAAGFFTALLLAWPYILLWDVLIDVQLNAFRLIFLFSYLIYFFAFFYSARAGAQVCEVLFKDNLPNFDITSKELPTHPIIKPIISLVGGAISAAASAFLVQGTV